MRSISQVMHPTLAQTLKRVGMRLVAGTRRSQAETICPEHGLDYATAACAAGLSQDDFNAVLSSGVFDRDFYLKAYPDIAQAGVNPLLHYLEHGRFEQRKASGTFDPAAYLKANPDVAKSGIEPFLHYVRIGRSAQAPRSRAELICRKLGLDVEELERKHLTVASLVDSLSHNAEYTEVIEPLLKEINHVYARFMLRDPTPPEIVRSIAHFYEAHDTRERRAAAVPRCRKHLGIRPLKVEMDIVNQCNLRCTMCMFSNPELYRRPKREMTMEDFARIAEQVFPLCSQVSLSVSTEPLLNRRLPEILQIVAEYEIPFVYMFTNGLLLHEKLIGKIINSKLHHLAISIDGATKDTYERIRVGGKFERLIANIQAVNRAKKQMGSKTPRISFNIVLMRSNIEELPALVHLAHSLEVNEMSAVHMVPLDLAVVDPKESLQWDKELCNRMLDETQALATHHHVHVSLPARFNIAGRDPRPIQVDATHPALRFLEPQPDATEQPSCLFPWHFVGLDSDGSLLPCGWWHNQPPMGNILTESFEVIWNSEEYRRLRSEHLLRRGLRSVCQTCPAAGMGKVDDAKAFVVRSLG
jgi:radical SAM protein with 4Fe4S-binding SPASM domain